MAELRCGHGSSKVRAFLLYHVNFHGGFHELIKNHFLIIMCYKFIVGNPETIEKVKERKD